mgnify:CR=1 FL=1
MGAFSSFTEIDVITDGDMFLVTDDTTTNSRKVSYETIRETLFADDVELFSDGELKLKLHQYSTNTDAPNISFYKARGTAASPTTVGATDNLSRHIAYAYNGTGNVMAGSLGFTASDGDGNANFTLKTRVSDSFGTRIQVTSDGEVHLLGDTTVQVSSSHNPGNVGEMVFEATNDTTLKVKVKGSDGVVRSVTLTLS